MLDAGAGPLDAGSQSPVLLDDGAVDALRVVPRLPVGYAAFRELGRLPVIRVGQRTTMTSTFDRTGGNEGADASHFLRQESASSFVALELGGPGILSFVRTNHWHGSPWHYVIDGVDSVVSEGSTSSPDDPVAGSTFLPVSAFPSPLALTWSTTRGADLSWLSIGFLDSVKIAYERTHYGTGYFIVQRFPLGASNLPEPLHAWTSSERPPADVLTLLSSVGQDRVQRGRDTHETTGKIALAGGQTVQLALLDDGPRSLRKLQLSVSPGDAAALAAARIRIYWDGSDVPAVDAPVPLFFGTGSLYNRARQEYLVNALMLSVRFGERIELTQSFPMPYQRGARVELVSGAAATSIDELRFVLWSEPSEDLPERLGSFHATFTDIPSPELGKDMVLLDTTHVEGGGHDYCGVLVGMAFTFSDRASLGTLEGDPRFYFDDSQSPQVQGTGTEEWAGGGDYWGGQTMTLPLAGHPVGAPSLLEAQTADDAIESAYRLLISDAMPFGKNARVQLEHGGNNGSSEHYRAVTFWYGRPEACLSKTDALQIGEPADEQAHGYLSPDATQPYSITSRFQAGPDHALGREVIPTTTSLGRATTGTSELTLSLNPDNHGVLLRRTLDYAFADQTAEVWLADGASAAEAPRFESAGTWKTPGSTRVVYSNPSGELDPATPTIQESNRRFRDEEFLLPEQLTRGRSKLRVRLVFVPSAKPLLPNGAPETSAWSEVGYRAYCYLLPR